MSNLVDVGRNGLVFAIGRERVGLQNGLERLVQGRIGLQQRRRQDLGRRHGRHRRHHLRNAKRRRLQLLLLLLLLLQLLLLELLLLLLLLLAGRRDGRGDAGLCEHLPGVHLLLEQVDVVLLALVDARLAHLAPTPQALVDPVAYGLLGHLLLDLVLELLARQHVLELERLAYVHGAVGEHVEHVVEVDVAVVVQVLDLVAHVLEEQPVLLELDLEATAQQAQQELDAATRYRALAVDVHYVPHDLKVAYVVVTVSVG